MEFRITNHISEKDRQEVYDGLLAYNLPRLGNREPEELGIFTYDADGRKLAGLICETHGYWLMVKYLWVTEAMRGRKIGSSLLKQAEKTASERGCRYVFLDTFGFQAPGFYEKQGYHAVFTLNSYPCSGKRIYFTKNL